MIKVKASGGCFTDVVKLVEQLKKEDKEVIIIADSLGGMIHPNVEPVEIKLIEKVEYCNYPETRRERRQKHKLKT